MDIVVYLDAPDPTKRCKKLTQFVVSQCFRASPRISDSWLHPSQAGLTWPLFSVCHAAAWILWRYPLTSTASARPISTRHVLLEPIARGPAAAHSSMADLSGRARIFWAFWAYSGPLLWRSIWDRNGSWSALIDCYSCSGTMLIMPYPTAWLRSTTGKGLAILLTELSDHEWPGLEGSFVIFVGMRSLRCNWFSKACHWLSAKPRPSEPVVKSTFQAPKSTGLHPKDILRQRRVPVDLKEGT